MVSEEDPWRDRHFLDPEKKKTAILRNEAERVEAAAARRDKKIKQHKSTVTHNVKHMLHSHSEILSLDASLKQIKSLSKSSSSNENIKALEKG